MQNIVQYEPPVYGDIAFPIIYHDDQMTPARRSIYTNWHEGVEVLYCLRGGAHVLLDGEMAAFHEGQMVVIGSNIIHALYADTEVCSYHCLIVDHEFLLSHGFKTQQLNIRAVIDDAESKACFQAIAVEFAREEALYKPAVLSAVLKLFVHLSRQHARPALAPGSQTERKRHTTIIQALHYIRTHLCRTIYIDDICKEVAVSKYYLCRMFKAYTGVPIVQYINLLKCDLARQRIVERGDTVCEAANFVGITNLSYFTRLYKRQLGVLPSRELGPRGDKRGDVFGKL